MAILLFAALLFLLCYPATHGTEVVVSVDGVVVARYPLSQPQTVSILGVGGENLLVIANGTASVTDADCPDRLCCRYPNISRVGETIVCLPHRLVVQIVGDSEVDGWLALPRREVAQ